MAPARALWLMPIGLRKSSISTSPGVGLASRASLSVIVADFDIFRLSFLPSKTDSPLLVDPDGILAISVTRQKLQPVAGRDTQIVQMAGGVQHTQFPKRPVLDIAGEPARTLTGPYPLRLAIPEGTDHRPSRMPLRGYLQRSLRWRCMKP